MLKKISFILSSVFLVKSDNEPSCIGIGRTIYGINLEGYNCIHQTLDYTTVASVANDGTVEIDSSIPGIPHLELYTGYIGEIYEGYCPSNTFVKTIYCDNTNYNPYPDCEGDLLTIRDGLCNSNNNNYECGWDGGDCCIQSCEGELCPIDNSNCIEPQYTPAPTDAPTNAPTTLAPTDAPTQTPTDAPTDDFWDKLKPNSTDHEYLWYVYASIILLLILIILLCIFKKCTSNNREEQNNSELNEPEFNDLENPFDE